MAIERFWVYPTCDIHLLLTAGADMQVEILGHDGLLDTWSDIAAHAQTQYLEFDAAIVTVNKGLFKPVAKGTTLGRIRHVDISDPADIIQTETLVRVVVHEAIDTFWFGNNRASIHEGESNYILSVFARFTDGTFGDISSHPYLNFSSANTAFLTVNNTNDKGRLTGVKSSAANGKPQRQIRYHQRLCNATG